jgi:hypothetical protein
VKQQELLWVIWSMSVHANVKRQVSPTGTGVWLRGSDVICAFAANTACLSHKQVSTAATSTASSCCLEIRTEQQLSLHLCARGTVADQPQQTTTHEPTMMKGGSATRPACH